MRKERKDAQDADQLKLGCVTFAGHALRQRVQGEIQHSEQYDPGNNQKDHDREEGIAPVGTRKKWW